VGEPAPILEPSQSGSNVPSCSWPLCRAIFADTPECRSLDVLAQDPIPSSTTRLPWFIARFIPFVAYSLIGELLGL
jgi:hypothetical protein